MLWVRTVVVLLVALSAFMWPRDMRRHWNSWTRRGRRITMAVMPVLVANGLGVIYAAYQQRPLSWVTWILLASYLILNGALLLRFANDDTTDRQYVRRR